MVKCFWAKRKTKYFGCIVGSGIARSSPSNVTTIKNWPLPETQKNAFSLFYRKYIHYNADCLAPLTDCAGNHDPGK